MTFVRTRIHPLFLTLLLSTGACAGTGAPVAEDRAASIRQQLRVDTYKNVSYVDEKNRPITAEQFDERVRSGASVSMSKKAEGDEEPVVTMRLAAKSPVSLKPSFKVKPGDQFPAFSLERLTGKQLDNKALMGKYTIVSFYFADCAPCITEIPELNALSEGRDDLNFIGMSFDSLAVTRKFVERHKLTWTLLSDAKKTLDAVGVTTYPAFALLDPQGKLVAIEPSYAIIKADKTLANWVARLTTSVAR